MLPDGERQDALAELAGFSLAKLDEGGVRFRVHGLVQEVTRERQDEGEKGISLRAALELVKNAMPGAPQDVRTWLLWDQLRSHMTTAVKYADRYDITDPTSYLMNQLGLLLLTKASYKDAEPLMRRALAIDEASYGPEHPCVAIRLNNLAQLLNDTNRLGEAEPLMRRVARILLVFTRSTGHAHPHLQGAFQNYNGLLEAMGLNGEQILERLFALGYESGFDEPTYRSLLSHMM